MKIAVIELPDYFEQGNCGDCPLVYFDEDGDPACGLGYNRKYCQLDIEERLNNDT